MNNPSGNPRAATAYGIETVAFKKVGINKALNECLKNVEPRQHSFVSEIVHGVLRWYWRLDFYATEILPRPFRRRDANLHCLLLAGLYQIEFMAVPDYAAVSATVAAAKDMGKPWASGALNLALRNFLKSKSELASAMSSESSRYSHPQWMIDRIRSEWPTRWEVILEANNTKPPMVLRINPDHATIADYLKKLQDVGIEAFPDETSPVGVCLKQPAVVSDLPGYYDGTVSVQDTASQLVAPIMDVQKNHRVLDACAAPGGKTAHILEMYFPVGKMVAVDKDARRCERIRENLDRTGFSATVHHADVACTKDWWDGVPFDRILVDAPCSGFGVIPRHPDIKHHRQPEDIQNWTREQYRILSALWPLLKYGGKLIYTTCSILDCENVGQVEKFLMHHPDCVAESLPAKIGFPRRVGGYQRLQGMYTGDGFFYARLKRCDGRSDAK